MRIYHIIIINQSLRVTATVDPTPNCELVEVKYPLIYPRIDLDITFFLENVNIIIIMICVVIIFAERDENM